MKYDFFYLQDFLKCVIDKIKRAQQQLHASHGIEHDWNLLQTCISLLEIIGDVYLKMNDLENQIVKAVQEKKKEIDENDVQISYLCSNYKICGTRELNDFQKLIKKTQHFSSFENRDGIFSSLHDAIKPVCEYVHDTTLATIFTPIENQLKALVESEDNIESNLPDYSFAPQEYITVIGQVDIMDMKSKYNRLTFSRNSF